MSNSGQNNLKGINFQVWVSLSLFLQFLKKPEFSHIQLEGKKLEDFTLYFNNGTKIIGEAKVRTEKVQPALLKEILKNIIQRKTFNSGDKILISCTSVSDYLFNNIKYAHSFEPIFNKFKNEFKYPDNYISLLDYVDFWIIDPKLNIELVKGLVADVVDVWLPDEELGRFVDSLMQKFMKLSESGSVYYRNDFFTEIQELKNDIISNASYYNPQYDAVEKQYDDLEAVLNGSSAHDKKLAKSAIGALSTNFGLLSFAKRKLEAKKIDDLKDWDSLWQLNRLRYFGYSIFDIFRKNTHTKENRKYIISYCKKFSSDIRGFYQDDYFVDNVARTIDDLLKVASVAERKSYLKDILFIIKELLKSRDFSYLKKPAYDGHDQWERAEVCKLLGKVYQEGSISMKKEIVDLIWKNFDLIEDEDGTLSRRVDLEIFSIIAEWLKNNFSKNFDIFIKKINHQYDESYGRFSKRSKKIYDGWEHMGGGTSFSGSHYDVRDRSFIVNILQAVLENKYNKDPEKTWKFIKTKCIFSEKEVSEEKPDFLNRSVYGIVINRYADSSIKKSEEAFTVLEDFLLQRKGIPHKSELIYQRIARMGNSLSSEKKMRLAKITLEKYKIPVTPFVEEIIRDLALSGNTNAQKEILSWFSDEKYYERGRIGGSVGASAIITFVEKDIDFGIKLLEAFISSQYFMKDKYSLFNTYDIARTIAKITKKDPSRGVAILNNIRADKNWGKNQRALFCFGLFDHHEKEIFEKETLLIIYKEVINPFLDSFNNDAREIIKIIPESGFREAIVKFAEALARHPNLLIKEATRIISVFINDPDPYLPGEDPDPENEKYNEHKKIVETGEDNPSITSVRGWCGWVLMKCAVLEGRSEIENVISLVSKLLKDENYYVLHMACFALAQLARIRLTCIDETKKELFLDSDPKKALKKAKHIENIAFNLLEKVQKLPEENAKKVLGKSVLRAFDAIRSLNQKEAIKFLSTVNKFPVEVREEAAPFFMYYAFFRKNSYDQFQFKFPGLYNDINSQEYNETLFEQILEKDIKNLQADNPENCFKIVANFERLLKDNKDNKTLETKSYKFLSLIAEKYANHTSGLIYRIAIDMFDNSSLGFEIWFKLLKEALVAELAFYKDKGFLGKVLPPDASQYYWYPSIWLPNIFTKTLEFGGEGKFLEIIEIIMNFPLAFELHIGGMPIDTLIGMVSKGNNDAKILLKKLYDFDPGKWRDLKDVVK